MLTRKEFLLHQINSLESLMSLMAAGGKSTPALVTYWEARIQQYTDEIETLDDLVPVFHNR